MAAHQMDAGSCGVSVGGEEGIWGGVVVGGLFGVFWDRMAEKQEMRPSFFFFFFVASPSGSCMEEGCEECFLAPPATFLAACTFLSISQGFGSWES